MKRMHKDKNNCFL